MFSLIFLFFLASEVFPGEVGKCRSECVEQNIYKIVRVHLKDDLVMAGVCRNSSQMEGTLSTVIPFVCNRNLGIWEFDLADEEGIAPFSVRCPPNDPVEPERLHSCPNASPVK